ncbi:MAG: DUF5693 family protein, partial [Syntrophomonadaceae bacterium]|nr:DUF5693 family protein [Syntrophomonadaceae bacterium]
DYFEEYRQIFHQYNTKYLIFANQVSGYPDNLQLMSDLVNEFNLLVGVIETSEQIKYIEQPGLEQILSAADYPINRVYSTGNDEFVQTVNDRFYRWIRAIVDRGIRILYLSTFKDVKLSASENLHNTIDTIGKFHQSIADKGFYINEDLPRLNSSYTGSVHSLMIAMSLLIGSLLYLAYLLNMRNPNYLMLLFFLGIIGVFALNMGASMNLSKVYALSGAVLYPSLSSLIWLRYLKAQKNSSWLPQIFISLLIIFAINLCGAYTIVSSLNDIRYIMNLQIFSGVKLAFLVPLALFLLNYFVCFTQDKGFVKNTWDTLQLKPNYLILALFLVAAAGGYYYIARSGNNVTQVSSFELRLREVLEMMFLARPRFKEFLIGYPAIIAAVYLYQKYRQSFVLFIMGLAAVIGSISMVNSFCHVFTAVSISWSRTLWGLVIGVLLGFAVLLGIMLLEAVYKFYLRKYIE